MDDLALDDHVSDYVKSALALQGYRLDEPAVSEIVAQFVRIHAIAMGMLAAPIDPAIEPVPSFVASSIP
jgi:hypothetical protein